MLSIYDEQTAVQQGSFQLRKKIESGCGDSIRVSGHFGICQINWLFCFQTYLCSDVSILYFYIDESVDVGRGGTYLGIFAKKWEKLTSPGIFRCSFIYKTQGLYSFDPPKLFLPPYGGSENMPLLQKKRALGEKVVCKMYVSNMTFFTWYDIVIPSRTPTDHPGIPFSFSPGSNSRPKGPFLA